MRSIYNFVVSPKGERYNNVKKVDENELIINSEIFNHQYINREAVVLTTPKISNTDIKDGDTVLVHHNVFRRWHDIKGREKNSRAFLEEGKYLVSPDQLYLYKSNGNWKSINGYCFVQPIKHQSAIEGFEVEDLQEMPLVGIVKYSDGTVEEGSLVGFTPSSEFEFIVEGQRMYRVLSKFITIKYEYQGNEEEYNPSWASSG